MRLSLVLFIFLFFSSEKAFCYDFQSFNNRVSEIKNLKELKSVQKEEIEKYLETKDRVHLINSKYVEFFIAALQDDRIKSIEILSHVLEMDDTGFPLQFGWLNYHMGANLSASGANQIALEYSREATRLANSTQDKILISLSNSLTGTIYFSLKKYELAEKFFNTAYQYYPENDRMNRASMLNNIGLCRFKQNDFRQAYTYYNSAIASLNKNSVLTIPEKNFNAVLRGNLGSSLHKMGYFKSSIDLLEEELEYYLKNKPVQYELTVPPLAELLELYSIINDQDKIKDILNKMELVQRALVNSEEFPQISETLYNHYNLNGPEIKRNLQTDIYYQRLTEHLKQKNKRTEELNDMVYRSRIAQFKKENEATRHEAEKVKIEKFYYQIIIILGFIFVSIMIIIFFISNRNRKRRMNAEMDVLEKEREIENQRIKLLDLENKDKQQQITQLAMNLTLRKETEKAFLQKINELKRKKSTDTEAILKELQISVSNLLNVDRRQTFIAVETDKVLKDFKSRLSNLHPALSKSDLEYCCYFRLKMSAKEIGAIHGQSDGSIRVLKNKIKNKLNLSPDQSLTDYLEELG